MNLSERDKNAIWHPFTQHQTADAPIAIVKGEDVLLYDDQGKVYIDAVSSWWTNIFGHCNKKIAEAIKNQLDTLEHVIFAGFTHPPAIELAESLLNILPSNQAKVFFSDNGSTSVEVAVKMALQYWYNKGIDKQLIVSFKNAYHGDTFGAMSVGARGVFNQPFESLFFDVLYIDLPNSDNFDQVKSDFIQILSTQKVAAFIFEPLIQGSAGMLLYESNYLDKLIEVANNYEVICIADEVMTGFGRTGKLLASDYLTNKPAIFCLSKGITGGFMPLGITSCTAVIYEAFLSTDKYKTFFHGHSYTGNPLACAAANASIELLQKSTHLINQLVDNQSIYFDKLKQHHKIENVRQLGTIVAFDVKTDNSANYFNDIRDFLYRNFIERGVLLRPLGNTVYVMPPYVITNEQLSKVYAVIFEVLDSI